MIQECHNIKAVDFLFQNEEGTNKIYYITTIANYRQLYAIEIYKYYIKCLFIWYIEQALPLIYVLTLG